ncbi:predicted protein [Nematostella vectensis]|uniref:Amidohydrolase-related domain-containing protein n=1 Tax=Nematostella vectensis TaxID=45351 RepID=A7S3C9_NEMVE|nr:predicted protein [Nematostella vectensis]|eukprot:XP_001633814.1 predicted protein [Nematostella vectensis]
MWDNKTFYYPWPGKELKDIYRPFSLEDLEEELTETPVRKAMFIQVNQTYEETDWILNLPDVNGTLEGIVGWVDLQDPKLESILERYKKFPKFRGVRNILEGEPDNAWLERPEVLRGLGILEKKGLTFDLLIRERHFQIANDVVKKFPRLKFMIDHIAKPNIKEGAIDSWKAGITELAKNPNVFCKISGMVTEADLCNWTKDDLKPYHVLSVFGTDRCVYGSDWPVCKVAGASYVGVFKAYTEIIADHVTKEERDAILCKNGRRFYNLDRL